MTTTKMRTASCTLLTVVKIPLAEPCPRSDVPLLASGLTLIMGCSYSRIFPYILCIVLQGSQGVAFRNSVVDNCFLVGNVIVSGLQALQTQGNGFISLCSTKKMYLSATTICTQL